MNQEETMSKDHSKSSGKSSSALVTPFLVISSILLARSGLGRLCPLEIRFRWVLEIPRSFASCVTVIRLWNNHSLRFILCLLQRINVSIVSFLDQVITFVLCLICNVCYISSNNKREKPDRRSTWITQNY